MFAKSCIISLKSRNLSAFPAVMDFDAIFFTALKFRRHVAQLFPRKFASFTIYRKRGKQIRRKMAEKFDLREEIVLCYDEP